MSRWTWHGGGLAAARLRFGDGPWLDLSTGINPHPWPGAHTMPINWHGLPDETALRDLEEAAAAHFGCNPGHVCAVPGTETGLRLVGELLPAAPAFHVTPSYSTHADMIPGSRPICFSEVGTADGSSLILANPNNPDGRLLDRSALADLLARRGGKGWLLLDEAFADCHPEHSLAAFVDDGRQLVVFRSFGKFFGLAGLRLGFVIAPAAIASRLRGRLGAWPVSAACLAIGSAAYRDDEWSSRMRLRLRAAAAGMDAMLTGLGYTVKGDCPLFRLIECQSGQALFERLAHRAILTRPFDAYPGWLRLGLPGTPEGLERLRAGLSAHG